MHFCFLNPPNEFYSPNSGGAIATIVMQTARALLQRGHQVSILSPSNEDAWYEVGSVVPLPIPVREDLSFFRRRLAGLSRRLHQWDWPYYGLYRRSFAAALRRLDPMPDVVIAFNDLVASRYIRRKLPHARIIVWLQNEQRTNQSGSRLASSLAATGHFLACSRYIKDWTCRTHSISSERVTIAPSGVDLEAFRPLECPSRRTGILRVLFLGRIDRNKGPDLVADAVAALRREGLHAELTVAGGIWFHGNNNPMSDPFFRSLQEKIHKAGGTYLGHITRDRVPSIFREHDVVMVLSRSNEPFGLVSLEAMASGCAVIASDRGGLPEACDGAAIMVDPENLPSVIASLRILATSPDRLQIQRSKSLERARRVPWSATAEVVERVATAAPDPSLQHS
jgi:glycosyltransferase involved in cell wall biosynthesis